MDLNMDLLVIKTQVHIMQFDWLETLLSGHQQTNCLQ